MRCKKKSLYGRDDNFALRTNPEFSGKRKQFVQQLIINLATLTDEIERLFEVLLQILMTGVRSGYLPVRDTPFLVIAG